MFIWHYIDLSHHVFSPTGDVIPATDVVVSKVNPDTPYISNFDSEQHQKQVYGHLKPGQTHSYETFQMSAMSNTLKSSLPSLFKVNGTSKSGFTRRTENDQALLHKCMDNVRLDERVQEHLKKTNPVELLALKAKERRTSISKETYIPIEATQIRHDPKEYSIGPREISGAVRDFHETAITYEHGSTPSTETQSHFVKWNLPDARPFSRRGTLKTNVSQSGYTESNTNQPSYPVRHKTVEIPKPNEMFEKVHRIYSRPLHKISI
jgi:hypothetical protein